MADDLLSLLTALRAGQPAAQATAAGQPQPQAATPPEPQPDLPNGGFSPAQSMRWLAWRNAKIQAAPVPPNVKQYMQQNEDLGEGETPQRVNPNAPTNQGTPPALIWPRSLDPRTGTALTPPGAAIPPGYTQDWFHNYSPQALPQATQVADLVQQQRQPSDTARLLAQLFPQPQQTEDRKMPGPGFIPGTLNLNQAIAPQVPEGQPRPFAPGEWVQNPNGSWSSEESVTVSGDQTFNGGKPTVLPSLWVKDGKAYVAKDEDEATALARASGLSWPSFPDMAAAEKFANEREAKWQGMKPADANKIAPLWQKPDAGPGQ